MKIGKKRRKHLELILLLDPYCDLEELVPKSKRELGRIKRNLIKQRPAKYQLIMDKKNADSKLFRYYYGENPNIRL